MEVTSVAKLKSYSGTSADVTKGRRVFLNPFLFTKEGHEKWASAIPFDDWLIQEGKVFTIEGKESPNTFYGQVLLSAEHLQGIGVLKVLHKDFLELCLFIPKRTVNLRPRVDAIS